MFRAEDVTEFLVPFLDLLAKVTALLMLAAVAAFFARRAPAATRHLFYLGALIAAFLLPITELSVPLRWGTTWTLPIPQRIVRQSEVSPTPVNTTSEQTPVSIPPSRTDTSPAAQPATTNSVAASEPAPPIALAPTRSIDTFALAKIAALVIYGAGFLLVLAQVVIGGWAIRCLVRASSVVASDMPLGAAMQAALSEAGAARGVLVTLRLAPDAAPMTWGWRRPTILLPTNAETWDADRLRAVLLHEIAHIVRRDWPTQMFAYLVCAAYWFHPLVWWAVSRLRAESERACDDRVLLAGVAPDAYATLLLDIARNSGVRGGGKGSVSSARFASSMARSGASSLKGRLAAILADAVPRRRLRRRYMVTLFSLFVLGTMSVNLFHLTATRAEEGSAAVALHALLGDAVKPDTALAFYRVPEDKRWVRDVGSGTTIELVGITQSTRPKDELQSWKPDGELYKKPLYDYPAGIYNYDSKTRNVEFAFRIHRPDGKIVGIESSVSGAMGWSGPSPDCWREPKEADPVYYAMKGGLRTVDAEYLVKRRTTDLQMRVAAGPWQTTATLNVPKTLQDEESRQTGVLQPTHVHNEFFGKDDVSFSTPIHGRSGNPLRHQPHFGFVVTDSASRFDADIVAVDTTGVVHRPDDIVIGGASDYKFRQTTVWFDEDHLPFAKLQELRFNVRPFHTVEFHNVALYPKENAR